MTELRVAELEKAMDKVIPQIDSLKESVMELTASVNMHSHGEALMEDTLKHINTNLHSLNEKLMTSTIERTRETNLALKPAFNQLRQHERQFVSNKTAGWFAAVFLFFFSVFGIMGTYILVDGKHDLILGQKHNESLIAKHANAIEHIERYKRNANANTNIRND